MAVMCNYLQKMQRKELSHVTDPVIQSYTQAIKLP